jgi:hypothetical protein
MLCAGGMVSACTPTATPMPVATQTLIPATATFTPVPVTPTLLPPTLPEPGDLAATPAIIPVAPLMSSEIALPDPFVQQMMADLAAFLNVDVRLVQYAKLEPAVWLNENLGCTFENLTMQPAATTTGFRLTFIVGQRTYIYHTAGTERFERCEATGTARDDLLVTIDPVALEMVGLAQRQLAQTLDLPQRRMRLVTVESRIWSDSSMGCPQEDVSYEPAQIPGYRIVIAAGDNEYHFHTDSERLYPCNLNN